MTKQLQTFFTTRKPPANAADVAARRNRLGFNGNEPDERVVVVSPGAHRRLLAEAERIRRLTLENARKSALIEAQSARIAAQAKRIAALEAIRAIDAPYPRVRDVIQAVLQMSGLTRSELLMRRRTYRILRPRQTAMFLCTKLTNRSFVEIGRQFGGYDHTTVMHAARKVELLMQQDERLRHEI